VTNVVKFYPNNSAENPDSVLEQAMGVYEDVVILGWDADENMECRATLGLSQEQVLYIVTKFTHKLMNGDYREE